MAYFPLFLETTGRRALIVGGGKTALEKLQKLVEFGLAIRVVAPDFLPDFSALAGVELVRREFNEHDLDDDLAFVVAATDDNDVNRVVAGLCRERRILVNVVDVPDESSFIFPAVLRRGALTAAVSTSGASPSLAAHIKELVARILPRRIDEILEFLADVRRDVKARIDDRRVRRNVLRKLWEEALRLERPLQEEETRLLVEKTVGASGGNGAPAVGSVALVGAGAGDASLITIRGMALIKRADVVLYDELIDKSLLEFAPAYSEKLPVGKRFGEGHARQDNINKLMIERAKEGLNVVRLKGGDPYLFGRGPEEAVALQDAGVTFEVVPGVTSAIYIPMEAGIPVTARGVSRSVHIVTAHTAKGNLLENLNWLAKTDGTLVFLMGLNLLERIVDGLIAAGKSPETPVAVLAGGNAPQRYETRGTLRDIVRIARERGVKTPAVIVVGDVAGMDLRSSLNSIL